MVRRRWGRRHEYGQYQFTVNRPAVKTTKLTSTKVDLLTVIVSKERNVSHQDLLPFLFGLVFLFFFCEVQQFISFGKLWLTDYKSCWDLFRFRNYRFRALFCVWTVFSRLGIALVSSAIICLTKRLRRNIDNMKWAWQAWCLYKDLNY